HCTYPPPPLPPFPTRRSSDLLPPIPPSRATTQARPGVDHGRRPREVPAVLGGRLCRTATPGEATGSRPVNIRSVGRNATGNTAQDRKSTRLNSSHVKISYAVF